MISTDPAPFPPKLAAWLAQDDKPTTNGTSDYTRIPQGERNTYLASLAGAARRKGATEQELRALLRLANERCDPPLDPRDADRIAKSISRYAPADAPTNGTGLDQEASSSDDVYRLLTDDEIDQLKDPEWLIQGAIPTNAFTVTYGPSGAYKTFDVASLGLATSHGLEWHGRPTKPGHVIYVLAEGIGGFKKRRRAWLRHRGLEGSPRFHLLPTAVPFTSPECIAKLIRTAQTLPEPPVLIIIDTLARSMPGGDENATKDMSELIAAVDHVRHQLACGVHLVHHTGHDTSRERGNSALRAAADTMIRTTKDADGTVKVKCDKQKDADEFGPDYLVFQEVLLTDSGVLVESEAPSGGNEGPTQRRATAAEIAGWIVSQPGHTATPSEIRHAFKISDGTLRGRRYELRRQGIEYIEDGLKSRYAATGPAYQATTETP